MIRQGESSSSSSTATTTPIWTILATSVISASSAILVSSCLTKNPKSGAIEVDQSSKNNGAMGTSIHSAKPDERIRSTTNTVVTRLSARVNKDLPLWLGAGYLIFNQRRSPTASERASDKLLDFLVVGLLLTYKAGSGESSHTDDVSDQKKGSQPPQSSSIATSSDLPPLPHNSTISPFDHVTDKMISPSSMVTPIINNGEKTSPTITPTIPTSSESTRYMELMVYNVSHSDMVLSLDAPLADLQVASTTATSPDANFCLCRPRFSTFDHFSKKLAGVLPTLRKESLVRFPRYERSDDCNRYLIKPQPMQDQLPIGFSLPVNESLQVTTSELNDLRVRGRDSSRIANFTNANTSTTGVNAVFFPLIGTLMPQWQAMIQQKYGGGTATSQQHQQPKQVLFLVSGVGSPRNWTHSMTGNSTQVCAQLMQHYLQTLYPHLVVVQIHSETNIFRYDENISFVQNELMPCIQAFRDAHAKGLPYPDEVMRTTTPSKAGLALVNAGRTMDNLPFMDDWKKSFHVTLSFGDGSPARNHAIQAALRAYRPTYYHCWQLKTFWHESKIVDSDIEIHSFEEMETVPALATKQLQDKPLVMQVVDEIKTFAVEMTRVLLSDNHDIQKFWLRKTHKPVLAVLAVQLPNGRLKLYRGTNMEVSMPTGSLCAERNVIGTALADNPHLKRQDLKAIAVLSVPQPKQVKGRLTRSGSVASYSSLPSLAPDFDNGDSPKLVPSYSSETLGALGESTSSFIQELNERPRALSNASNSSAMKTPPLYPNTNAGGAVPPAISLGEAAGGPPPPQSPPARRIPVYHGGLVESSSSNRNGNGNPSSNKRTTKKATSKSRKRHLFVHSGDDMNPLRPCGACNEWLKKIAESNPYFQILTFTDADCNGVYCGFCEE